MRISQIAKRAGVHIETIRFYERKGLIAQPPRPNGGYRDYPKEAVAKIRFIRRAKDLGFSLAEIEQLLSLQTNPKATCANVKQRAEAKILAIQERVKDLQTMKRALGNLVESCSGSGTLDHCPIMDCIALFAVVQDLTGISGHGFGFFKSALRATYGRFQHCVYSHLLFSFLFARRFLE